MTDKIPTHDDKGYPLNNNVDFSTFYTTPEEFVQVPAIAYNMFGIDPDRYLVSTHGRFYNKLLNSYIPRNLVPDRNDDISYYHSRVQIIEKYLYPLIG